jgi:hypothetical protein
MDIRVPKRRQAREAKHDGVYNEPFHSYPFRFNRRFYPFNALRSLLGIGTNGEGPIYAGIYEGT